MVKDTIKKLQFRILKLEYQANLKKAFYDNQWHNIITEMEKLNLDMGQVREYATQAEESLAEKNMFENHRDFLLEIEKELREIKS